MNRPFPLRVLPHGLRDSFYSRFYAKRHADYADLFQSAVLSHSPSITMQLIPGDQISGFIAFTGVYERALTNRIQSVAKQGGLMVDVGANLGYFSLIWASARPDNRVIAVEASPRNVSLLNANVTRNRLEKQIEVRGVGAGKAAGTLRFDVGPQEQTGWGGFTLDPSVTSIEVDVVRVDDLVEKDAVIDLLKVDIEGADTWALMGCERLLRERRIKEIWFEQNKPRMELLSIGLEEANEFLSKMGYKATPDGDTSQGLVEWRAVPK